ncbi:hypothetical protein PHSC3_001581 [Chlamydiales bacterium STE3]|nr:hypothetical protein PHSC3_001581 [Chlamydiales bacterium STE3]
MYWMKKWAFSLTFCALLFSPMFMGALHASSSIKADQLSARSGHGGRGHHHGDWGGHHRGWGDHHHRDWDGGGWYGNYGGWGVGFYGGPAYYYYDSGSPYDDSYDYTPYYYDYY